MTLNSSRRRTIGNVYGFISIGKWLSAHPRTVKRSQIELRGMINSNVCVYVRVFAKDWTRGCLSALRMKAASACSFLAPFLTRWWPPRDQVDRWKRFRFCCPWADLCAWKTTSTFRNWRVSCQKFDTHLGNNRGSNDARGRNHVGKKLDKGEHTDTCESKKGNIVAKMSLKSEQCEMFRIRSGYEKMVRLTKTEDKAAARGFSKGKFQKL